MEFWEGSRNGTFLQELWSNDLVEGRESIYDSFNSPFPAHLQVFFLSLIQMLHDNISVHQNTIVTRKTSHINLLLF